MGVVSVKGSSVSPRDVRQLEYTEGEDWDRKVTSVLDVLLQSQLLGYERGGTRVFYYDLDSTFQDNGPWSHREYCGHVVD